MKKQVLFVVDEQMYGGVSEVLKNILRLLDYTQIDVDLLILHNRGDGLDKIPTEVNVLTGTPFFSIIDLPIKTIIKSKNIRDIVNKIKLILSMKTGYIKKKIRKERNKILSKKYQLEIAFKDGFCPIFTAYGDAEKKVNWLHVDYATVDYTAHYHNLFLDVYNKIDTIIAITEDVKKTFCSIYPIEEKVQVIENAIDVDGIKEKAKAFSVDYDTTKLNLIMVGRIAYQKAYPRLIRQMAKLKKEERLKENVVLHIVGDGEEIEEVKRLIQENHLQKNVQLHGYQKNPYPYIASADMLLLTSYYEGLGLTLYEAILLGVPTFATKFANVEKTLANGKYGKIVENTEEGIYEGLKQILEDKDRIKVLKEQTKGFIYTKNKEIKEQIKQLIEEN